MAKIFVFIAMVLAVAMGKNPQPQVETALWFVVCGILVAIIGMATVEILERR